MLLGRLWGVGMSEKRRVYESGKVERNPWVRPLAFAVGGGALTYTIASYAPNLNDFGVVLASGFGGVGGLLVEMLLGLRD